MTTPSGTDHEAGARRRLKNGRNQALSGLRILVGRARHQASALANGLRNLGAEVIEIPFLEIRKPASYKSMDSALRKLGDYDWLIVTSVNGVDAFWERVQRLHMTTRQLAHLRVAAIGPATAKAIEKCGLRVEVVPKEYVAESVVDSLRARVAGKRVLVARAKVARDVIPRELGRLGAKVDVVEAYETGIPRGSQAPLRAIFEDPKRRPHLITFTSSSSARNFVSMLERACGNPRQRSSTGLLQGVRMASIGPVTSATLRDLGLLVDVEAKEYTISGLIHAIVAAQPTTD